MSTKRSFCVVSAVCGSFLAYGLEPLVSAGPEYGEVAIAKSAASTLKKSDKNGDGFVTADEAELIFRRSKYLDTNHDGKLSSDEFLARKRSFLKSPGKQYHDVCFKRVGTEKVYLDIFMPDEDTATHKPVVLYTHGGGWAAGSRMGAGAASFADVHAQLLKKGFCVVSVGYRLVHKDGDTTMRDCVVDSKDALRFISAYSKELGIDPNRVYTFGDSAGGHLAQMVLFSPANDQLGDPELAAYSYKTVAGVSWYGPCDFQDEQLFNHDDRENFRDRFGPRILGKNSNPDDKMKLYREMSPVAYVTKDSPPLLMIQGDKDTTIPVKQAYRMQENLDVTGAPVEIMIINNAGHNWRKVDADISPTRAVIIERTVDFFIKHM